ncbi:MAG: hypothetical protein Q7R72_01730 [bacterium]|nr:hypothetical protein [bacterium]
MHFETRFTYHGNMRLSGRTSLSDVEIDTLISSGLAVKAGTEFGTSKVHWILYSEADKQSIVVIRDEQTKEVITILNEIFQDGQAIPKHFASLSQTLAGLNDKPLLAGINLGALKAYAPETFLSVIFLISDPISWRTKIRNVGGMLGEIKNLHKPWQDEFCLDRLWKKLREDIFSEVTIEQVIVRIGRDEAYTSTLVGQTVKRPLL